MQTSNKEDSNLRSFLNYLLVDKGLSNNTVKAYEADISSFFQWLDNEDLKYKNLQEGHINQYISCLLYTSPSPRDRQKSRMPSSA